ncbi:MAG: hypothetical protein ACRD50_16775 [Candidatus Acidiferrales bacterium]
MSTAPGPASVPPPTAPPKSNALWWILGIVGGLVVLLVLGVSLISFLVLRQFHVRESGKTVEIQTPAGSLKVNSGGSHTSGLPVYSGATPLATEGGNIEISQANGTGVGVAAEKYRTSDSLDQVAAWYTEHLGPSFRREKPEEAEKYSHAVSVGSADLAFVRDTGEVTQIVGLTQKADGIEIALVRIGKREPQ